MSYSGWWGYCPKCGCDNGKYNVIHDSFVKITYECNECHWTGGWNEILTEEQYINEKRFETLKKILDELKINSNEW